MTPEAAARICATPLAGPAEARMQSVYADTLRWRNAAMEACPARHDTGALQVAGRFVPSVAVETALGVSDMALLVARRLVRAQPSPEARQPDQIIVCQGSFEHALTLSCACRLQCELGGARSPIAIGQLQGASFLMALQVTRAMMRSDPGMQYVLLVAAERWRPPFARTVGPLTALGDGAAAVLVSRSVRSGWQLEALAVRTPTSGDASCAVHVGVDPAMLVAVIEECCAQVWLQPSAVDRVLPACIDAELTREISARCGLPLWRNRDAQLASCGYLGTADTPVQLDGLLRATTPEHGQRILIWSAGLEKQVACALLRYTEGES